MDVYKCVYVTPGAGTGRNSNAIHMGGGVGGGGAMGPSPYAIAVGPRQVKIPKIQQKSQI